ncbi:MULTISPECIES: stage II sporulation protein P [unclassified Romboutsia]|uniref:stage II sporulation protein P n=1 Tax=unclassified Romboutsia TaxID=2626894 RepID=UPI00082188DA|nr:MULTISPECIES: stage II sporulation protein P [unclassified Romboutsia]SCH36947.1 stage II sporulation protein P [uncultured Clostridium sp.]
MEKKRIKAKLLACVLICILPTTTFAMDKDDFFRYLIDSSYPETDTNQEKDSAIKNEEESEESEDYIKVHIGEENIPTLNAGSEETKKESAIALSTQYKDNIRVTSSNPRILIYHTHSAETYSNSPDGNYHSQDIENSVMQVGSLLTTELSNKGWGVVHTTKYHDYPSYNNSYSSSLSTIKTLLSQYNTVDIAIDLHRDASAEVNEESNKNYTTTINGEKVAQFCFVVGMKNENIDEVMKTATDLTNLANEKYPGIAKAVVEKPYGRFNQYVADKGILIEVGSNATSIEEASASVKYIADVLDSYFK